MKKGVYHTKKDNVILVTAILFILTGFLFSQTNSFDITGMFAKREPCKLTKDPFSRVAYCRGISASEYCVWNEKIKSCRFVSKYALCGKNNPHGFCSKPADTCTPSEFSNICRKK